MIDKIIEKHLAPGRWKIMLHEAGGHDVTGVYLKGNRNRPFPLYRVDEKTFSERYPLDAHHDGPPVLRGIPSMYFSRGMTVYMWPAPLHEWVLQVRLQKKDKAA